MQKRDKTNYRSANNKRRQTTIGLLKVFLTFVALIGIVGFSIRAFGAEEQSVPNKQSSVQDYPWYGYDSYSKGYLDYSPLKTYHNLKVNLEGSKDYQTYCFNLTKHFPSKLDSVRSQWYKKLEGTNENFIKLADKPRIEDGQLQQNILRILYNGYPNNRNGIMKGIDPLNAILVTQNAIWYYTDSAQINPDEIFKTEARSNGINDQQLGLMRKALKELIDPNLGSKYSNKTPSGYRLNIFESHDKAFQNLLSAEYVPDTPPKPGEEPPAKTEKTSVIIRKYAEGDYSKLLEGATLKLSQIEGSGFQEKIFDSNKSGEKVELPNGTYVLSELKPPQGYGVATPITFKVAAGKVLIKNKEGQFVENQNKEIAEPYSVTAFNDFEEIGYLSDFNNYGKFYYAKNTNGTSQVVYCFNADLHSPPDSYDHGANIDPDVSESKEIKYTHVSGYDLYKYAVTPRDKDADLFLKHIKKILDKGYKKKGDTYKTLTEAQFRAATQLAIYYYTDSADLTTLKTYNDNKGYHGFDKLDDATLAVVHELITYAEDVTLPMTQNLDFFVPNSSRYQALIGTQYHPNELIDVISMEDKQAPIIPITHKLTISKTVTGTIADKKKEFNFEIHLKSSDGQAISGTYPTNSGELTVTDGRATFTLKDGESLIVEGLPSGYSYEITETGASDYEVSVNGKNAPDGKATKASVKEDETVAFENRKDLVPPTGLTTDGAIYLWLLLLVPLGLWVWLIGRKGLKND
ncbi:TPA: pilus ancillary protein 1 [Streptococcus pyogenes]|uniref:pilus ancillary protein 1 n=1 Tax=Streptococcus pyogenes TaxID=1314 RepID=UPI0003C7AA37|nr:pilus ancillary protein 1 [Streptococcus pyogenes]AXI57292.1 pilus ancillary protein 1 [Streptococcus pyogenes]ESU93269.1 fibronectin-binding signal sequence domain protein [Streptococcus pyogenes GA16797]OAC48958.1 fibronectin-binding protein [Streptococcus pyogenes]OAC57434.1 fibronectin-binding protein [Streptococcus pyogenes]OAC77501.1 fibronectin-binding protein [Streptococcus pyogenes]